MNRQNITKTCKKNDCFIIITIFFMFYVLLFNIKLFQYRQIRWNILFKITIYLYGTYILLFHRMFVYRVWLLIETTRHQHNISNYFFRTKTLIMKELSFKSNVTKWKTFQGIVIFYSILLVWNSLKLRRKIFSTPFFSWEKNNHYRHVLEVIDKIYIFENLPLLFSF